jgi:SEC-C motif-containing protein
MSTCPCRMTEQGQQLSYEKCCQPFLDGKKKAPTAESLMRARYCAYAMKNIDFIDDTQIAAENEVFDKEEAMKWANSSEWLGLQIVKTQKGQPEDNSGVVEFIAQYKDKNSGTELKHHETALFGKKDGAWMFKEGQIHGAQPLRRLEPKIGRNDPCSCGSGKKSKKCCAA